MSAVSISLGPRVLTTTSSIAAPTLTTTRPRGQDDGGCTQLPRIMISDTPNLHLCPSSIQEKAFAAFLLVLLHAALSKPVYQFHVDDLAF